MALPPMRRRANTLLNIAEAVCSSQDTTEDTAFRPNVWISLNASLVCLNIAELGHFDT
jgi:hypothetical protein